MKTICPPSCIKFGIHRRVLPWVFVLFAFILGSSRVVSAQNRYILIDGSSTVHPMMQIACEEYMKDLGNGVKIEETFSGTTAGMKKFLAGEIDVAGASRPITREELKTAKVYQIPFVEVPIAYDALTIAVNPDCTWTNSIKISELKNLWKRASEGKITLWSQIRSGWPETPIKLFGAGKDSGTFDYFKDVVLGKAEELRNDYTASEDKDVIATGIEKTPGAIGFLPYSYFVKEGVRLKALAIEFDYDAIKGQAVQGAMAVAPSEQAVLQGTYIPFGRPLFLYVNVKSLNAKPHLKDFLYNYLMTADDIAARVHYLGLPKISYARSIADLEAKNVGTRFSGEPEIGLSVNDMINRRPR
jgi:phosphate transport system substrate-binding protein